VRAIVHDGIGHFVNFECRNAELGINAFVRGLRKVFVRAISVMRIQRQQTKIDIIDLTFRETSVDVTHRVRVREGRRVTFRPYNIGVQTLRKRQRGKNGQDDQGVNLIKTIHHVIPRILESKFSVKRTGKETPNALHPNFFNIISMSLILYENRNLARKK
jgi:hypothetical protein